MPTERPVVKSLIYLAGAVSGLWIGLPVAMKILVCVMGADVITGITRAAIEGQLNSHCSFKGMMKKTAMLVVTTLGVLLDQWVRPEMHLGSIVATGFTATEGFSIIENLEAIGVPIPPAFRDLFKRMKPKDDDKDETDEKKKEGK